MFSIVWLGRWQRILSWPKAAHPLLWRLCRIDLLYAHLAMSFVFNHLDAPRHRRGSPWSVGRCPRQSMKAGRKALNNLFFSTPNSNRLRDGVYERICVRHPIQRSNRFVVPEPPAKSPDGLVIRGCNPEHQEDKISSLRRHGCHGKRFDTYVTPYLAGRAQRYFVLVRISVVQYELALYPTQVSD
jgi:hypothetical protein